MLSLHTTSLHTLTRTHERTESTLVLERSVVRSSELVLIEGIAVNA